MRFSSILLSGVQHFVTPWTAAHQASLSITNSQSFLKLLTFMLQNWTAFKPSPTVYLPPGPIRNGQFLNLRPELEETIELPSGH